MKIAVLGSNFIRIPPRPEDIPTGFSGAPEMITHEIAEGLVKRGHEVTLFASGDSETAGKLVSVTDTAVCKMEKKTPEHAFNNESMLANACYRRAQTGEFDIIHSHLVIKSAFFSTFVKTPTVVTLHSPLDGESGYVLSNYKTGQYYVSISKRQREKLPDLNFAGNVYHGIDTAKMPFNDQKGNYYVYVGRLSQHKGVAQAIQAVKRTGSKLVILGTGDDNSQYYHIQLKPYIDGERIVEQGIVDKQVLYECMSGAKALLFPSIWEEPFGLVMIEAMACGTPVIAFANGSVPEIIKDGETGFIVNSTSLSLRGEWRIGEVGIEGLVRGINMIDGFSETEYNRMSANSRKHVEDNFNIEKMVDGYEKIFSEIIELHKANNS